MKKAVVIVPTYNEKDNIERLIPFLEKEVFPEVKEWEMGLLIADDTSPDQTADIVKEFMKKYKNLDISSGKKAGLGAAYVRGMEYAIDHMHAQVVFEMDADGQHDATKIPQFLEKIDEGYDFVIGTRYSAGGSIPKSWALYRKFLSVVGNQIIRIVLMRFSIHDWTGGYRAFTKEVFEKEKHKLKKFKGYNFQVGSLLSSVQDGFRVAEVPFHFGERTQGESKIQSGDTIVKTLTFVITERIKELAFGKFGKFLVVGGFGFILNAVILRVGVETFKLNPTIANLLGSVVAIFSNFNFNNHWTFREHKIQGIERYLVKLFHFYATSAFGVILIQTGTIFLGDALFGRKFYFLYFLIGTAFLLVWNFTIYHKFIWKKK